jgi:hypothetical protein
MDLDLAIWQIAPNASYRLNADKSAIAEWRGPDLQPTPTQLQTAWDAYIAAQQQAEQTAEAATTERTAAASDLASQYQTLLDRADQIVSQMATISSAQSMTQAQSLAALKSIANAVSDEAVGIKRLARLLKAVVS